MRQVALVSSQIWKEIVGFQLVGQCCLRGDGYISIISTTLYDMDADLAVACFRQLFVIPA